MQLGDRCVLLGDALILGDLHLGMEESLRQKGTLIPRTQFKLIATDISKLIRLHKPKRIVLNGDIKHDFGKISEQEWREIIRLLDYLLKRCEVVLIKGNHDPVTKIIAQKRNLVVHDYLVIDDNYICHGDVVPENEAIKNAKRIIISHEHPAISLRDEHKMETYKCFLKTPWKKKELIVLPSFTPLVEGSDILKEKLFSPFLKTVKKVEVIIVQNGELFNFGSVTLP